MKTVIRPEAPTKDIPCASAKGVFSNMPFVRGVLQSVGVMANVGVVLLEMAAATKMQHSMQKLAEPQVSKQLQNILSTLFCTRQESIQLLSEIRRRALEQEVGRWSPHQ